MREISTKKSAPKIKKEETLEDIKKELATNLFTTTIKTNIEILDKALGGGLEPDDMIMLVSEAGCGKTTIALQIAREMCYQGKNVVYVDSEGKISQNLLESMKILEDGKLNDKFIYVKKSTFTDVENTLDKLINTGEISFVIIDSLSGIVPDEFLRNDKKKVSITTNNSMYASKPLGLFMQKYNGISKQKKICFILIQQFRQKIDLRIGSILKIAGPKACTYFPSQILKLAPIKATGTAEDDEKSTSNEKFKTMTKLFGIGHSLEIEIIKTNKNNANQRYPLYLIYGRGVSDVFNQLYDLINKGKIEKDGSYYWVECEVGKLHLHGIKEVYDYIANHQEYYIKLLNNKD